MTNDIYLCAFVVVGLIAAFGIGFRTGGSKYRQKYRDDLVIFQGVINKWKNENEKLKNDHAREISHIATSEWNNGFEAASAQYEKEMEYIYQWLDEHNGSSDELRKLIKELETEEETNQ